MIVAVDVVECIHAIAACLEIAQGELSQLIGLGYTLKRQGGDCCVGGVGVYSYEHTLGGLKCACLEHHS